MKKIIGLLFCIVVCYSVNGQQVQQALQRMLDDNDLPGIQLVYTVNGKTYNYNAGVNKLGAHQQVNSNTIFRAGSLGKCYFAYAVMKLYDQGTISLDTPLLNYIQTYDRFDLTDPRFKKITARMVLSHTSGMPEYQPIKNAKLKLLFDPGTSFSYSGEGIWLLQKVIEKIIGKPFEEIMQEQVFKPLRMKFSTYVQTANMDSVMLGTENKAYEWMRPNAGFTLLSNAHDYNIFLQAIITGKGLKAGTNKIMFSKNSDAQWFRGRIVPADRHIDWGIGLGLQQNEKGKSIWHWGDIDDFHSFFIAFPATKQSLVFFTRGQSALKITDGIINICLGKQTTWATQWIGTDNRYDEPESMFKLFDDLHKHGFRNTPIILRSLQKKGHKFTENDIFNYGNVLLKQKRFKPAIFIFKQLVKQYPYSANAYYGFAEACENINDTVTALTNYKRCLALDSANISARLHIKSLKNKRYFTLIELTAFAGKFNRENTPGRFFNINIEQNKLVLTDADGNAVDLIHIENMQFYNTERHLQFDFVKSADGSINKILVNKTIVLNRITI